MALYDNFATEYDQNAGEQGDYFHRTQIDPHVIKLVGDVDGKALYDIGCGNGYLARYFANQGAMVSASDSSKELIKIAESKGGNVSYKIHDATDFSKYQDEQFDCVTMNMVIHYIDDIDKLFKGIARILKPTGRLVISMSHFFRPAYPYAEWVKGEIEGKEHLFIKTTGYLNHRIKKAISIWDKKTELTFYDHTLQELVNNLSANNLYIDQIIEPISEGFAKNFSQDLQETIDIPTFLIMRAIKR